MTLELDKSIDTSALRKNAGYSNSFYTNPWVCYIRVYGDDANRYLQAQTTNDINQLQVGDSQLSCLIDRKSRPVGCFQVYKLKNDFAIICDITQREAILQHLENFRFADKVYFDTQPVNFLTIQGAKSRSVVQKLLDGVPPRDLFEKDAAAGSIADNEVQIFKSSMTGEEGFLVIYSDPPIMLFSDKEPEDPVGPKLDAVAEEMGLVKLDDRILNTARVEAGYPKLGVDFTEENLLAETNLTETAVSYSKGCFQGQEVLARIRTQGSPSRALVGLTIAPPPATPWAIDTEIVFEGETVGWIKSNCYSEFLKRYVAFAMVKRDYRTPGKTREVTIGNAKVNATVELLPLYQPKSPQEIAKELYEEALSFFAKEDETKETDDWQSINLLKEALTLDPFLEDAYEALGVILSKRGQLDEAIDLMEYLAKLNPDCVMAHTNLSVFYVEKGWKEKAEDEKAISMSIRMKLAAAEVSKTKKEEEQRKASEQETLQRMGMFKQVLEIDEDDQLANYGYGDCLVNLNRFEEAIPHLKKSLELKPTHSAGYLVLAQAYEGLEKIDEARQTYETGIEVAAKRGDMEPLKKMKAQLAQL
jgi:folate-binding protein YgfZ